MSFDVVDFSLLFGLLSWFKVMGIVLTIAAVTLTATTLAAGGATGPLQILEQLIAGYRDLRGTSLRRIWAMTLLTIREAVRRKAPLVGVVFGVLFLFAGWFLTDSKSDMELQVKVYVSFVLWAISWVILPSVLLLACWGLPEDIRLRSLHTVVTKPVRRHEIVLGRMLGFSLVGLLGLAVMGFAGYIWIWRQIPKEVRETHLIARVPIYGVMGFLDREGNPAREGVNTGDEWMFRSYVEGNTKATAMWDFANLRFGANPPESLRMESSFQAFRTYKGNIEKGLLCQFTLVNDEKKIRVPLKVFELQEFRENVYNVPKALQDDAGKPVDLYTDLISDGKLRVEARCLSSQQFIGMARPDLFVRLPDRPFEVSFFKAVLGIGLMMTMVVVLGVTASCFVKGPVAMLLSIFVLFIGRVGQPFFAEFTSSGWKGGGPIESIYRILKHLNPTVSLEQTFPARIMQGIDAAAMNFLWAVKYLFPDFKYFEMTEYVANGFDVPWGAALLPSIALTAGYVVPWVVVGYYSLKLRELESK